MNAGRLPFSEIVIDISDNPHWEKKKKGRNNNNCVSHRVFLPYIMCGNQMS